MRFVLELGSHMPEHATLAVTPEAGQRQHYQFPLANTPTIVEYILSDMGALSVGRGTQWLDLLASHDVAMAGNPATTLHLVAAFRQREVVKIHLSQRPHEVEVELLPRLWVMCWRQGTLVSARLFTVADEGTDLPRSLADTVQLTAYPLGNVYAPSGALCWGSVTPPRFSTGAVKAVDSAFFSSEFNGDLSRMVGDPIDGTSLFAWVSDGPREARNGRDVLVMSLMDTTDGGTTTTIGAVIARPEGG